MVNYSFDYHREQDVHVFQDQHAMAFDTPHLHSFTIYKQFQSDSF